MRTTAASAVPSAVGKVIKASSSSTAPPTPLTTGTNMDSDDDFISNMSSDDELMQDDTDNDDVSGAEGRYPSDTVPVPL